LSKVPQRSLLFPRPPPGEEYILQIDSHTRFRPGWDTTLVALEARCPSPRAVLTTYPLGYRLEQQALVDAQGGLMAHVARPGTALLPEDAETRHSNQIK
jgi:hypothetical protein